MAKTAPGTIKRTKGIGGSDVAVLCGLSQYKTPYQLYLEKRGEIQEDSEEKELQRWGKRLEKPIADEFAFRSGRKIWRQRRTIRHPEHKFLLANIDRWQERAGEKGVYEGKNANVRQRAIWLEGGVPQGYYLQLQHYLLVTGCRFGTFGVLFGGNEFHAFDVERDDNTIRDMLALELDFWRRVKDGDPPDFTFGEAGAKLVKRMYQKATSSKEHLFEGTEAEAKIKRLLQLRAVAKDRKQQIEDLESWVKLHMRDAELGLLPGVARFSWKNSVRKTLDLDGIKRDLSEAIKPYWQETETRTFRTTDLIGEESHNINDPQDKDEAITISSGVRQIELE